VRERHKRQMNTQELNGYHEKLVADHKGLLAMDESNSTCNKRFAKAGIPQTVEARRAYRELILTTPGLGESISGVILYDETIRQQKKDGTPFVKVITDAGIIPGIKVDSGAKRDGGSSRRENNRRTGRIAGPPQEYFQMGARFAKWRAVIAMGDGIPSRGCIEANTHALARYAAFVPGSRTGPRRRTGSAHDGEHSMGRVGRQRRKVPASRFQPALHTAGGAGRHDPKTNMVVPGLSCPRQEEVSEVAVGEQQYQVRLVDCEQVEVAEVADATVRCLCEPFPQPCLNRFLVGWPTQRTGLGPVERHECSVQVALPLGAGVFICSRHQHRRWRFGWELKPMSKRRSKLCFTAPNATRRPPRRIHCQDGTNIGGSNHGNHNHFIQSWCGRVSPRECRGYAVRRVFQLGAAHEAEK